MRGGHYCSVQGQLAARIALRDGEGNRCTLYVVPLTDTLARVKPGVVTAGGAQIQLWRAPTASISLRGNREKPTEGINRPAGTSENEDHKSYRTMKTRIGDFIKRHFGRLLLFGGLGAYVIASGVTDRARPAPRSRQPSACHRSFLLRTLLKLRPL